MVIVLVVLGVIALALLVVVAVMRGRAATAAAVLVDAERRLVLADERTEKAEAESRSAEARRKTAEDQVADLRQAVTTAEQAATDAEEARVAAEDEAGARVAEAVAAAEEARVAGERLVESAAVRADGGGLWFLEAVRVERRWRSTVVGSTEVSLFEGADEPARLALAAVIDAIREESGTSFDLAWQLTEVVPPPLAFSLVRAGEEILSAVAITSNGGVLEVVPEAGAVVLALRADPEPDLPAELLAVFDVLGWEVGGDHGTPRAVTVRIPLGEQPTLP